MGINHVEPGGAPLVVRLSESVIMIKVSVGPLDNNAYLLQRAAGGSVLIDAADDGSTSEDHRRSATGRDRDHPSAR